MTGALVPPGVVRVTPAGPAAAAGATVVTWVDDTTLKAAGAAPKWTAVAPLRALPVRATVFPPATGPWTGVTALTTGVAVV